MSRLAPLFANITIDDINLFLRSRSNIVSGLSEGVGDVRERIAVSFLRVTMASKSGQI